jgi:hypothetical protein
MDHLIFDHSILYLSNLELIVKSPTLGKKMRCFGSTNEYPVGVVFALPTAFSKDESEDVATKRTRTWSWPSGYSAKTEFNIDRNGNLINGREEALVPLSGLRKMNHAYLHDTDYSELQHC